MNFIKSESFFKGTVILIGANAVSKILGAILKIPLTYILGEEGMAIYQTAFSVYIMMLTLTTTGMPFAISQYTSYERALKRYGNIGAAVKLSALIMSASGILISAIMFLCAGFFAYSMKDPMAQLAIRAIAPSVFFVALGEVYKSFYQGYSCQTPTAISQVVESFIKLIVGYMLACYFSVYSQKYSAAAAIFGVTAGEFFATLVLILLFIPFLSELKSQRATNSHTEITKSLFSVALPMTFISLAGSGLALLETSVIRNMLTAVTFDEASAIDFLRRYAPYTELFNNLIYEKKLSFDGARWLFGAYSGYASTIFNLPIGVLASFGVSLFPIIASAKALGDYSKINRTLRNVTNAVTALAVPCSVLLWVFSEKILYLLFKNTASALMLSFMAPMVITTALTQLSGTAMHASGRIMTPFFYSLICSFVRIVLSVTLMSIPKINILGAIISSFVSGVLYLLLSTATLRRDGIFMMSPMTFVKTLMAGAGMTLTAKLLLPPVSAHFSSVFVIIAICAGISLLVYFATLYLLNVMNGVLKDTHIIFRG